MLTIELSAGCASRVIALAPAVETRPKVVVITSSEAKALALVDLHGLGEVANVYHKHPLVL